MSALEDDSRKLSIRTDGLPEHKKFENSEQTQHKVKALLRNKMPLSVGLDCAYRIGSMETSNGSGSRHKPRTVLAKLTKTTDRARIFKNHSKRTGTTIFVNEDLSPSTLAVRKEKVPELLEKRK